jgi:predicted DNA-binding antitoxin AbrB/MazE fold protein
MGSTTKARFSDGVLKPLEALELKEGEEVTITIVSSQPKSGDDWLERTAGGWTGLVDAVSGELLQGADFSGNRPAKVSWVSLSERIRWQ